MDLKHELRSLMDPGMGYFRASMQPHTHTEHSGECVSMNGNQMPPGSQENDSRVFTPDNVI